MGTDASHQDSQHTYQGHVNMIKLDFREPISGDLYAAFLAYSRRIARSMCLIVEDEARMSANVSQVLEQLKPWGLSRELVLEWPGTRIEDCDQAAVRYEFEYSDSVVAVMTGAASSIDSWRSPLLPEDPHLMRADGSLWFGATTTEGWSWLETLPDEMGELLKALPDIVGLLVPVAADGS